MGFPFLRSSSKCGDSRPRLSGRAKLDIQLVKHCWGRGSGPEDSRGRLSPRFRFQIRTTCPESQSLKNQRSWKTLSTVFAAAPDGWRASVRLQPLPLLYRKMRPLRVESAKFPSRRENIPAPAGIGPPLGRFPGSRPPVFSRLSPGTDWNLQRSELTVLVL